jgi:hypothetical protein
VKAWTALNGLFLIALFAGTAVPAQTSSSAGHRNPLDEALELYQQYSGKTVLRSPKLPPLAEFNKPIPSSDTNGMRIVLEYDLLNHGIQIIPHNDVFALAVEVGWTNSPEAQYLATVKPRPTDASSSASLIPNSADQTPERKAIPPGTIDFRNADLNQVLDLYGMLVNRTILRSGQLNSSTYALRTQTPLTKSGAIYAVETLFALNGIAAVEDGTNFIQVVPLRQISNLTLRAPQPIEGEPRIAAERVRFGGTVFEPGKPPKHFPNSANDVVSFYAELTERSAVHSDKAGRQSVLFKAQTELTKSELLYGLETALALHGLTIIEVDDKTIQAGYIRERKKAGKKSR